MKKRAKREVEEARSKRAVTKQRSPVSRESLASVQQHMEAFERQINEAIEMNVVEAPDGYLESVEVIKPVSGLPAPMLKLDGDIDKQIRVALGCMSASLGYTEEQRYVMVFNQFVQTGTMESLVRRSGSCPASLVSTLMHVIGHTHDIMVAYQAKKTAANLWKLLYVGKKKPAHRPGAHVRIEAKALPSFFQFRRLCDELKANGCALNFESSGPASSDVDTVDMTGGHRERDDLAVGGTLASQSRTESYRVHFVSLLLEAVVDFCGFIDEAGVSLPPKETLEATNLFDIILCLRYDPNAYRIQEGLDAALLALMGAFDNATWRGRLPTISFSLATSFSIKTTKALRAKVICELPCGFRIMETRMSSDRRRCTELQQCAASLLLDTILEPADSTKNPDLNLVALTPLDVESRIKGESWFRKPETLTDISDDVGGAHVMNHFTRVELLLRLADMILWPCILTAMNTSSEENIKHLRPDFLKMWTSFLGQVQRRIRTLNPEEQAVKTMANFLRMRYDHCAEELQRDRY